MFVFNWLTPYLVDDFFYLFNFSTSEPMESVWEIFPSMAAHANIMNGRLSAHSLVQLFLLMPPIIFDIVNALFFCLQIALIVSFSSASRYRPLLAATVFCAIFYYEPAFGQVNLWQDGSTNYLWSIVFTLAYLRPFVSRFLSGEGKQAPVYQRILFLLFSFFAGSYSETASSAAVFMAFLLVIADAWLNHKKISKFGLLCVAAAAAGYLSIYLAPAQWNNKSVDMSLRVFLYYTRNATAMYSSFGVLISAAVILLVVNYYRKTSVKTQVLGLIFIAGSLAANYIMVFASYYTERSAVAAFTLILSAVVVLAPPLLEDIQWKPLLVSAAVILMLSCFQPLIAGGLDISHCYLHVMRNRATIAESVENGIYDITLPVVNPSTKYSAFYDLGYLDTDDPQGWPNNAMAVYYGVNSILGVK